MVSINIGNEKGFTLIELLVVVAIIGILSSIVLTSLNSARGKARYAKAVEELHSIEHAAVLDYDDNGNYAPDLVPGPGERFIPKYLSGWPTPPCSGWIYDWDNWDGGSTIRITLRRADWTGIYYYCIESTGNCRDNEPFPADGTNIKILASKTLTCNE